MCTQFLKPRAGLFIYFACCNGALLICTLAFFFVFGPLNYYQYIGYILYMCSAIIVGLVSIPTSLELMADKNVQGIRKVLFPVGFLLALIISGLSVLHLYPDPSLDSMYTYFSENLLKHNNKPCRFIDILQSVSPCCGFMNILDYAKISKTGVFSVPDNCCRYPSRGCGDNIALENVNSTIVKYGYFEAFDSSDIYKQGCISTEYGIIPSSVLDIYKVIWLFPLLQSIHISILVYILISVQVDRVHDALCLNEPTSKMYP